MGVSSTVQILIGFPLGLMLGHLLATTLLADIHPFFFKRWLHSRRTKKFIEIGGQRFHAKVISKCLNDRFELIGKREEYEDLLRKIRINLETGLINGWMISDVVAGLVERPNGRHDLARHKQAALFYLLFNRNRTLISFPKPVKRRFPKILKIVDVARGKRVHLAVGSDFLPIEDLTVEFPLHEQVVAPAEVVVDQGDNRAAK